jgi:hypothetical protein
MEIRVPMVAAAFYQTAQVPLVKDKLLAIRQKFGPEIRLASRLTNLSPELITSVIFIESGGRAEAISAAGAVGLMQVKPATAPGIIHLYKKEGLLSIALQQQLRPHLGAILDCIMRQRYMDQLKPEFNIVLGSMLLNLLCHQHLENGQLRLDKVIARYNRGYFYKPKGTAQELLASAPAETKAYILKLVGINSTLDILAT